MNEEFIKAFATYARADYIFESEEYPHVNGYVIRVDERSGPDAFVALIAEWHNPRRVVVLDFDVMSFEGVSKSKHLQLSHAALLDMANKKELVQNVPF